jgi:peptide/nickel transport system substrate-binding protein
LNNERKKRLLALSFIAVFTLMTAGPLLVDAQTTLPGTLKNGPYVNKVVFNVITQDDQQVLALQDDEIDLIGDMVDPSFLDTLTEAENIDVANVKRNGYGYVNINTAKYPLNITNFRRAIAFALDKEAISDDAWDGLSYPQDSPVPEVNPWSIEGQLSYTYYEANVALGNQLLDAAGFAIPEGETFL